MGIQDRASVREQLFGGAADVMGVCMGQKVHITYVVATRLDRLLLYSVVTSKVSIDTTTATAREGRVSTRYKNGSMSSKKQNVRRV